MRRKAQGAGDQPGVVGRLSRSRRRFEVLNRGTRLAKTGTASPVLGSRPVLACRALPKKLPNPRISILDPFARLSVISFRIALRAASTTDRGRCG